jgi:tetratricopeptide repeat protein 30
MYVCGAQIATDTWFLAKRCFVGLLEALAKHMYMLPDATFHELITCVSVVPL